jgi:hypothetical protein
MHRRKKPNPMDMNTYTPRQRANIEAGKRLMETYTPEEQAWRARFPLLKLWGYSLRRRYDPTKPSSWTVPGYENVDPEQFEDWIVSEVMDQLPQIFP